jgi:phosphoserine phosphatase
VPTTSTGGFLAEKLGHAHAMKDAEALYAQGKVANDYVSTLDGKFYKGLSKADVFELLQDIPTIDHIQETVEQLHQQNIPTVLCTLAWNFVAEFFAKRYGFEAWSGPSLVLDDKGRFTGDIDQHFDEFGKPVFIAAQCERLGITLDQVAHIGDSRSDIELFKQTGRAIAINATDDARQHAHLSLTTDSLLDVLPLIHSSH